MYLFRFLMHSLYNIVSIFRSKIRYKLFFIYFFVITIPILFFGLLSFILSSNVIENNFIKYKDHLNSQTIRLMEENIHNLTRQSMAIYTSLDDIMYILNTPVDKLDKKYPAIYTRVNTYMESIIQGNDRISALTLIAKDGTIKYYGSKNYAMENSYNLSGESWFSKVLSSQGPPVLLEPHNNKFIIGDKNIVISIARPVINLSTYETCGIMLLDQNISLFSGIFKNIELEPEEVITILGKSGEIIYTNNTTINSENYQSILNGKNALLPSFKYSLNGEEILVTQKASAEFGWKVVSLIPISELRTKSMFLKDINISLLLVLIVFTFIISVFTSYLITIPLKKLIISFKKLQQGDFSVNVEIQGNDELAEIGLTFNTMVLNIRTLIENKYEQGILRKQAELESLQSQINPHFLFNTLNSIKAVSDKGNAEKTSVMVQNLSDIFRYNLNRGDFFVKFSQELEFIKKYLYLQECRFSDRYDVYFDIDNMALNYSIPRFTLQPVVENALYHGLESKLEKGELRIAAKSIDDKFILYISNDGIPIPSDELIQLNSLLDENPEVTLNLNREKLGIFNVNARIKFHYGNEYGLKIFSKPDANTTVKITLPVTK